MTKDELLEKLKAQDLTEEQIIELEKVRTGETLEKTFVEKAEKILTDLINALNPSRRLLWFRATVFIVFCLLLYLLSLRPTTTDTQIWTVIGAFIGFVFGNKSSFFRF